MKCVQIRQPCIPLLSAHGTRDSCTSSKRTEPNKRTWIKVVNDKISRPRRKALVEPQRIPPVHHDQVAEPLMSRLVRYHVRRLELDRVVRGPLVKEDLGRAIHDQTPVLHGARDELGDDDVVALGERLVDSKHVGKVVERRRRVLEGELGVLGVTWWRVDPHGDLLALVLAGGELLDALKLPDGPGEKLYRMVSAVSRYVLSGAGGLAISNMYS